MLQCSGGLLYNSIVGLFKIDQMRKTLKGTSVVPDRTFLDGQERDPRDLYEMVKEYLGSIESVRTEADKRVYSAGKQIRSLSNNTGRYQSLL